jgi:hypothetical protein
MEFVILFGVFAVLLLIGVPVAFSLLTATVATVLYLALPPTTPPRTATRG